MEEKTINNIELFSDNMKQLEEIVNNMEQGNLPLEKAIIQFEQGVELANKCQQTLQNAKQKVQVINSSKQTAFEPSNKIKD